MFRTLSLAVLIPVALLAQTTGPDQTKVGAGNAAASALATDSALVQSSYQYLLRQANQIQDGWIRNQTLDAIRNTNTFVASRAGVTDPMKDDMIKKLIDAGLAASGGAANINGGMKAAIFPPTRR